MGFVDGETLELVDVHPDPRVRIPPNRVVLRSDVRYVRRRQRARELMQVAPQFSARVRFAIVRPERKRDEVPREVRAAVQQQKRKERNRARTAVKSIGL